MLSLYGIPNCGSVKKARLWLENHGIDYCFHDFKKAGIDAARLESWLDQVPADTLLNRKGTTWRSLSDADKARAASREGTIGLMQQYPSLIKRPVVETGSSLLVGFDETRYTESFGA